MKFSHRYKKLLDNNGNLIKSARLLTFIPVTLESLSQEFKDYDTDDGLFTLPESGDYLLLIFLKQSGDLFTTLRKNTPKNRTQFQPLIGKDVPIELWKC